jgi:CRP-like cAMP-binding protein
MVMESSRPSEPAAARCAGPFDRLAPADLQALLALGRPRSFRAEETVLAQGQHNGALFFVQSGLLHVRRRGKGRAVHLGRLEPGAFCGEISLFDPGATTAAVEALSDGKLTEIRRSDLERFIAARLAAGVQLLTGLIEEMARRLRRTDERLVDTIFWGGVLK